MECVRDSPCSRPDSKVGATTSNLVAKPSIAKILAGLRILKPELVNDEHAQSCGPLLWSRPTGHRQWTRDLETSARVRARARQEGQLRAGPCPLLRARSSSFGLRQFQRVLLLLLVLSFSFPPSKAAATAARPNHLGNQHGTSRLYGRQREWRGACSAILEILITLKGKKHVDTLTVGMEAKVPPAILVFFPFSTPPPPPPTLSPPPSPHRPAVRARSPFLRPSSFVPLLAPLFLLVSCAPKVASRQTSRRSPKPTVESSVSIHSASLLVCLPPR